MMKSQTGRREEIAREIECHKADSDLGAMVLGRIVDDNRSQIIAALRALPQRSADNTGVREALEKIAACALCGYMLNGRESWGDLAALISKFNSELQKRVMIATAALAAPQEHRNGPQEALCPKPPCTAFPDCGCNIPQEQEPKS